jgi:hypothetical protein
MNINHIMSWARKSGIHIQSNDENFKMLKKFAEYAISHERTRCAKMCDRMANDTKFVDVANETARQLAVKIRTERLG